MGNESDGGKPVSFTKKIFRLCSKLLQFVAWAIWAVLTVAVVVYLVFGLLCLYSTQMKMEVIFSNRINRPFFSNISDCRSFGIVKCKNIFLDGNVGKLGAWLISPASEQYVTKPAYILYLHGNMGSRGLHHRVLLYKKLSRMGYHVLAIDYRGFGDSDGSPTEIGVVEDAKVGYQYLAKIAHGRAMYIWGHSLGSAVAVQLAAYINTEARQCNGIILEAPFNNMTDAIKHSPLTMPVINFIPNIDSYIDDVKNVFRSNYWIQKVTTPIIIFHDLSDHILNINLARKLMLAAKSTGSSNVHMIELDEKLYHIDIHKAKHFIKHVTEFIHHTS